MGKLFGKKKFIIQLETYKVAVVCNRLLNSARTCTHGIYESLKTVLADGTFSLSRI
jgi:hypothetical protein